MQALTCYTPRDTVCLCCIAQEELWDLPISHKRGCCIRLIGIQYAYSNIQCFGVLCLPMHLWWRHVLHEIRKYAFPQRTSRQVEGGHADASFRESEFSRQWVGATFCRECKLDKFQRIFECARGVVRSARKLLWHFWVFKRLFLCDWESIITGNYHLHTTATVRQIPCKTLCNSRWYTKSFIFYHSAWIHFRTARNANTKESVLTVVLRACLKKYNIASAQGVR